MAKLLEGKLLAESIRQEIIQRARVLENKPVLASLMVGDNAAVCAYAQSQARAAASLGVIYRLHKFTQQASERELIEFIKKLNSDRSVRGIIVLSPLPGQINYKKINEFILPEKDIEGICPENLGRLFLGGSRIVPCTAAAVMELLNSTGIDLCGKEVVVVGHSEIVGKPLALLLLDKLATVQVCHLGTSCAGKLEEDVRRAEILIVAVGKPGLIKGDWVKPGAIVIDVGINRVGEKIVGDVEFAAAEKRAAYITPVPGGVGPLTVVMLMRNLVIAASA